MPETDDLQTRTLLTFSALTDLPQEWPGALIVGLGLEADGLALALAANIAGAACLLIEPDPALCRASMRVGAVDFLVNTVDESLRVLKNEIRQKKPLSVALQLGLEPALTELLERGVLPTLFLAGTGVEPLKAEAVRVWGALGCALALPATDVNPMTHSFADGTGLRSFDQQVLADTAVDDPMRPWIVAAPRLFHRDRPPHRVLARGAGAPKDRVALS